ncbi:DUF4197 domain-containing protein [Sulfurospirillum barnesii]|uniref:DUF4197 domain-containing protein n=1 Tax=Sulfurospirillum barnesii (strain ATCC 700032 / DSM 10660 / SES-3) TaxID=760154 RepID=I3XZB9_SULBS|nr:DUF4197 domain-containing protein [Sulfurospirillum barnesii]AFL69293.1 hypothetical protein Sulba_2014 [Sulfurospirillum barnesii SES-3]
MLKKSLIMLTPLLLCAANWQDTLNTAVNAASSTQTTTKANTTSQSTATSGVKEALSLGAKQAVSLLGKENGYLNNSAVKIPLPSSMQPVATAAEKLGGKRYVDDFVQTMNTAATKSVPKTASILSDTITSMSVEDAQAIVSGGNTAATDYFKNKAGSKLLSAIMPIIKESIGESQVMNSYQSLKNFAGKSSATQAIGNHALVTQASGLAKGLGMGDVVPNEDEDIESYVGRKTLDGLFYMIAEKEKALRSNPLASGSSIIQQVFGK